MKAMCLALAAVWIGPALASATVPRSFTEDFSTTQFEDTLYTTADWDTAAGELTLFTLEMSPVSTFAAGSDIIDVTTWGDEAYVTYDGPAGELGASDRGNNESREPGSCPSPRPVPKTDLMPTVYSTRSR